jgi:hypothetical protein
LQTGGSLPFDLLQDVQIQLVSQRFAQKILDKSFAWDPLKEKPTNDNWDLTDAKLPAKSDGSTYWNTG